MKNVDIETVRWLRDEAREEGDNELIGACNLALEGDAAAAQRVAETVKTRVARAHEAHRSYGHS